MVPNLIIKKLFMCKFTNKVSHDRTGIIMWFMTLPACALRSVRSDAATFPSISL